MITGTAVLYSNSLGRLTFGPFPAQLFDDDHFQRWLQVFHGRLTGKLAHGANARSIRVLGIVTRRRCGAAERR